MISSLSSLCLAAPTASFDPMGLLPIFFIFIVFYVLTIFPHQKKMKKHKKLLSELKRGDKVLTTGGIFATVSKIVDDHEIVLEIAENVNVRCTRYCVSDVIVR
jgi:preprotein translocase subunit YajC